MFDAAFAQLSEEYQFNNFKAFGHSNGGLIWTRWIETYYADYKDDIKLRVLMTVASPFNLAETSINIRTGQRVSAMVFLIVKYPWIKRVLTKSYAGSIYRLALSCSARRMSTIAKGTNHPKSPHSDPLPDDELYPLPHVARDDG